jgi:hypothetical protein
VLRRWLRGQATRPGGLNHRRVVALGLIGVGAGKGRNGAVERIAAAEVAADQGRALSRPLPRPRWPKSYNTFVIGNVGLGKSGGKWTKLSCRRLKDNAARLQLFALAYNLANSLRQLALPRSVRKWNLTSLREKLVKVGAKVVSHAKYVIFQLAEVAAPRKLFAAILSRIGRLRPACASG